VGEELISLEKLRTALKEFKGNQYLNFIGTEEVKMQDIKQKKMKEIVIRH